jgi:hypothetical protein
MAGAKATTTLWPPPSTTGYGGSEITVARCGQHFDATETDMGEGNFRTLAREWFIRGCRTPPQRVTTDTTKR